MKILQQFRCRFYVVNTFSRYLLKALHAEVGDTAAEGSVGALEGELKGADLLEGFIAGHQAYVRTKGLQLIEH